MVQKILLYVLRRACSPCNKWGSVELAPDSPTGLRHHQRIDGVGSVGPHIMAQHARLYFVRGGAAAPAAPRLSQLRWARTNPWLDSLPLLHRERGGVG